MISSKWIFKTKHSTDGSIENYKAISVAHRFSQKEGIDYEDTFAQVARYTSIRTFLALTSKKKSNLHHMDVKTTFLNGLIEEEVYIKKMQGFDTNDQKNHLCRLKKELYGLKKAPRSWYGRIDGFLMILGFTKSKADPNLTWTSLSEPVT